MKKSVEKVDNFYEVFKLIDYGKDSEGVPLGPTGSQEMWEKYGKRYTCKGLVSLIETEKASNFILPEDIIKDILVHYSQCYEKKQNYLNNK